MQQHQHPPKPCKDNLWSVLKLSNISDSLGEEKGGGGGGEERKIKPCTQLDQK